MDPMHSWMNELINENESSFEMYPDLKWINPYEAMTLEEERDNLISNYSDKVKWLFKHTKPYINSISTGCLLCGHGEWSCLFITGRCNARCFYCPAPQNNDDQPTAQTLTFENADDYARYINELNFKACSFSGGEPLLVFKRLASFLTTIKRKCDPGLYTWLYTNGILGSHDIFRQLAEIGLNEVRFDIGATDYDLSTIEKASPYIKNLTVEIPAVPNTDDFYFKLLKELVNAGVTNLNLHQLRLTQHNVKKLHTRNYTYLHGEQPVSVDSELTALRIIRMADQENLPIGINYCSFQYKNRFQKAGYRNKIAQKYLAGYEISEMGYGYNLYTTDNGISYPRPDNIPPEILIPVCKEEFLANPLKFKNIIISFTGATLCDKESREFNDSLIKKNHGNIKVNTGKALPYITIENSKLSRLADILKPNKYSCIDDNELFKIWKYLHIEDGLRTYF
ncbi:MAG: radical SAM protein [Bacteroidales bacterium]|nr:radical SAM protein [Bacteroidales bacterium]